MIDDIDRQILVSLQEDARIPNAEIARRIGMAPSAVLDRIRKLEERGVVQRYESRLSAKALGLGLTAFIFVRGEEMGTGTTPIGDALAAIAEVQEVHHVAGEDCYLVKLRTADAEALGTLLREKVGRIPGVRSTRTTIALGTLKETTMLPIAAGAARGAGTNRERI